MVNFTTLRRPCDETCVLDVGDHPFIRHRTVIAYGRGKMVPASGHDQLKPLADERVTRTVLLRIMRGSQGHQGLAEDMRVAIENTLARIDG